MQNSPMKLEITQDKLVDILMHAATREDIANLSNKTDAQISKLEDKIDKLDSRIDKLDAKIDIQTARLEDKVDTQVERLDKKIDSIYRLLIASILVPILLFIIGRLHF